MHSKYEIPAALNSVRLHDGFWKQIVDRTIHSMLPHVLKQCEDEGHIRNMEIAAGQSQGEYSGGADRDSDLFKVLEGAAYAIAIEPDAELELRLDSLISLIGAAQQPDGYLQSFISSQKPEERYTDLERSHELYCAGHLIEAAVAHYESTGKRSFLEIAVRLADHLDAAFGPGKRETAPGHQEVELALIRLYHTTGEKRYLDLGRYFIDMRGDKKRVEREYAGKLIIEDDRTPGRNRPPEYRQDHLPILEQTFATGHAVRAGYTYAALADIAMEYQSREHEATAKAIWENIVTKKLYLSGGVGTHQYHDEGFGDDYVLPNTGYCETCGGVAFMLFSHRLGLLTGDAKYADIIELILYNHFLSSTDLSGCNTFYRNPLSAQGPRKRHPWNYPACCPTNVVRIIPQLAKFMYATKDDSLFVDQFASSSATLKIGDTDLSVTQATNYPWEGRISITLNPESPTEFSLHVRIPGWVAGKPVPSELYEGQSSESAVIAVNGERFSVPSAVNGYCVIRRLWQQGDTVEMELPMPNQRVRANPAVEADVGKVALMRGPLLYCFEETDLETDPEEWTLSANEPLKSHHDPDLLGGVTTITDAAGKILAVPFNVWNNREPGKMAVWVTAFDNI